MKEILFRKMLYNFKVLIEKITILMEYHREKETTHCRNPNRSIDIGGGKRKYTYFR